MSRLLYALIRVTCCAVLLACVAAVGLGRSAPEPASFGLFRPSRLEAINGYHFQSGQHGPRLFDPDSGRYSRLELPGDDFIDCATFADWEDDEGTSIVVGRWVHRNSSDGICDGYGMGRYRYPDGEMIDRVPLEIMPVGRACFVPGQRSAVVFAAGDGRLHHLDFEPDRRGSRSTVRVPEPQVIQWKESAGEKPLTFHDPVWPADERLAGRMLVAVAVKRESRPGEWLRVCEIWWVQFDPDRTAIVAAGRLIRPRVPAPATDGIDEVQPSVSATPGGGVTLGYLSQMDGASGWNLMVAPIEFDPATGVPTVRREASVQIAETRAHTPPIFSRDGRWVYTLPRRDPKPDRFERLALPESVLSSRSSRSHFAVRATRPTWN